MASANPITEFQNALERAKAHQVDTAPVALGTADADGRPSVRMVLLRGADERGFVFHTNYGEPQGPGARRQSQRRVVLSLADAGRADSDRRHGPQAAGRRIRRVFRLPPARKPAWCLGVGPEPDASQSRAARRGIPRNRATVCRTDRSTTALLGWLPPGAAAHRVLVRPP